MFELSGWNALNTQLGSDNLNILSKKRVNPLKIIHPGKLGREKMAPSLGLFMLKVVFISRFCIGGMYILNVCRTLINGGTY